MGGDVLSAQQLSQILLDGVPLARAMDARVVSVDDGRAVLHAPLEPNRNVHGAAFAGSLYSLASLAGWLAASGRIQGSVQGPRGAGTRRRGRGRRPRGARRASGPGRSG